MGNLSKFLHSFKMVLKLLNAEKVVLQWYFSRSLYIRAFYIFIGCLKIIKTLLYTGSDFLTSLTKAFYARQVIL